MYCEGRPNAHRRASTAIEVRIRPRRMINYTERLTLLMQDIVTRVEALSFIDMADVSHVDIHDAAPARRAHPLPAPKGFTDRGACKAALELHHKGVICFVQGESEHWFCHLAHSRAPLE